MVEMNAFGNLITGLNQPGPNYRPGIDPEHAFYNYSPLPAASILAPPDATGGNDAIPPTLGPGGYVSPDENSGSDERGGTGPFGGDPDGSGPLTGPGGFDIGSFSTLYAGWASTSTLVRSGRLATSGSDDRAALDAAFNGPVPWMLDEF